MPLHDKTADKVSTNLSTSCYMHGFQNILFQTMEENSEVKIGAILCCKRNYFMHGAPRTLTTQGLTERSNRSWKEDIRAIITYMTRMSKDGVSTQNKQHRQETSYHRAIKLTPYQAVFGIKPHREIVETTEQQSEKEIEEKGNDDVSMSTTDKTGDMEMPRKKQNILKNQGKYNNDIIQQTKQERKSLNLRYQTWCQSK